MHKGLISGGAALLIALVCGRAPDAHVQNAASVGSDCWFEISVNAPVDSIPSRALYIGSDGQIHSYYRGTDPNHVHNSQTGQNFTRNADSSWSDDATKEHVDTIPTRALYLDDKGHIHSYYRVDDQNHVHNSQTGQDFVRGPCPPPFVPMQPGLSPG